MKRTINILIASLMALSVNSCNLDILPDSSVSADSFWSTESDAASAVNGLYSKFRSSISIHQWIYWFEARSGNIGPGSTAGGISIYNNNDVTPILDDTNWVSLYNVTSQANAIINNIDKIKFKNPIVRDQLIAEAHFFRAWCYFNLVRLWGDVPIITNFISSLNDPQLYPERSPKAKVWELIISDISEADRLYVSSAVATRNKVSRPAILMLKTDIYLWLYKVEGGTPQDLATAEAAVDEVLGYPVAQFDMMGTYAGAFDVDNNKEIIFAMFYDIIEHTTQYGTLLAQSSNVPASHKNNPIPCGSSSNHAMAFSNDFMTKYRNRTPGDTRAEYICNDTDISGTNYRWTKKQMGAMNGNQRVFTTDTRIYRFAEARMFKAEILAAKNDIPEAVGQLNKVVARAYGNGNHYSTSMSASDFLTALLDERMIEFAGECKSWFDVIRFGEAFTRVSTLVGREQDKSGNILYLPVHHISITRNNKISQTLGYE